MDMESKSMGRGPKAWWSWKSPVGLGFFLATAALALVLVIYSVGELIVVFSSQSYSAQPSGAAMMQDSGPTMMPASGTTK